MLPPPAPGHEDHASDLHHQVQQSGLPTAGVGFPPANPSVVANPPFTSNSTAPPPPPQGFPLAAYSSVPTLPMTASPSFKAGPPASSPTDAASDAKRPRFMTKKAIEGMETLKKEGRGELNSRTPDARIANLKKYVEEQANKQGKAVEAGWWEKGWTITIVPRQNDPSNKDPYYFTPAGKRYRSRIDVFRHLVGDATNQYDMGHKATGKPRTRRTTSKDGEWVVVNVGDQAVIGRRIEVYWPEEREWFKGYVREHEGNSYCVEYDNRCKEYHDLTEFEFNWLNARDKPVEQWVLCDDAACGQWRLVSATYMATLTDGLWYCKNNPDAQFCCGQPSNDEIDPRMEQPAAVAAAAAAANPASTSASTAPPPQGSSPASVPTPRMTASPSSEPGSPPSSPNAAASDAPDAKRRKVSTHEPAEVETATETQDAARESSPVALGEDNARGPTLVPPSTPAAMANTEKLDSPPPMLDDDGCIDDDDEEPSEERELMDRLPETKAAAEADQQHPVTQEEAVVEEGEREESMEGVNSEDSGLASKLVEVLRQKGQSKAEAAELKEKLQEKLQDFLTASRRSASELEASKLKVAALTREKGELNERSAALQQQAAAKLKELKEQVQAMAASQSTASELQAKVAALTQEKDKLTQEKDKLNELLVESTTRNKEAHDAAVADVPQRGNGDPHDNECRDKLRKLIQHIDDKDKPALMTAINTGINQLPVVNAAAPKDPWTFDDIPKYFKKGATVHQLRVVHTVFTRHLVKHNVLEANDELGLLSAHAKPGTQLPCPAAAELEMEHEEAATTDLGSLLQRMQQYTRSLNDSEESKLVMDVAQKLEVLAKQVTELQEQVTRHHDLSDELAAEKAELEKAAVADRGVKKDLEAKVAELKGRLQAARERAAAADAASYTARNAAVAAVAKATELQATTAASQSTASGLQAKVAALTQEKDGFLAKLERAAAEDGVVRKELEAKVAELEKQVQTREARLDILATEKAELQQARDAAVAEAAETQEQLTQLEVDRDMEMAEPAQQPALQQMAELKGKLQASELKVAALTQEKDKLNKQVAELKEQMQPVAGDPTLREIFRNHVRLPTVPEETIMAALREEGLDEVSDWARLDETSFTAACTALGLSLDFPLQIGHRWRLRKETAPAVPPPMPPPQHPMPPQHMPPQHMPPQQYPYQHPYQLPIPAHAGYFMPQHPMPQ